MQLDFKDKRVVLTGRFSNTKDAFTKELEALGAKVTKKVSSRTQILITGKVTGGAEYLNAKNAGATILTEAQARAFLNGEEPEIEETVEQQGTISLHELIGTARSILAQPPSVENWHTLTGLFDQCRMEEHQPLSDLIHSYIQSWSYRTMAGLSGTCILPKHIEEGKYSLSYQVDRYQTNHEVRVAPLDWVGELAQGVDSAKYNLIHALDLRYSKIPNRTVKKLLEHPQLNNVERLYLTHFKPLDQSLTLAILNSKRLTHLNYLALYDVDETAAHVLCISAESHLELKTLDISNTIYTTPNLTKAIAISKLPHLEELIVHSNFDEQRALLRLLAENKEAIAPKLHTLNITHSPPSAHKTRAIRGTGILSQVHTLALGKGCYSTSSHAPDNWPTLLKLPLPSSVKELDMSQLHYESKPVHKVPDHIVDNIFHTLLESRLTLHIEHLKLGPWWHDPRVQKIAIAVRPELTITAF